MLFFPGVEYIFFKDQIDVNLLPLLVEINVRGVVYLL